MESNLVSLHSKFNVIDHFRNVQVKPIMLGNQKLKFYRLVKAYFQVIQRNESSIDVLE